MTEWQWNVVLALIRVVIRILEDGTNATLAPRDVNLLHEALEREKNYDKS